MISFIVFALALILMLVGGPAFGQDDPEVGGKVSMGLSVFEMLAPVITALLGWLALRLNGWLKTKIKNETLAGMLARTNDQVWSLVKEANQTAVAGLKAAHDPASPGGVKVLESELKKIKADVVSNFKKLWGAAGLAELGKVLGLDETTLDKWIGSRVEAAVHDLKRDPQQPTP